MVQCGVRKPASSKPAPAIRSVKARALVVPLERGTREERLSGTTRGLALTLGWPGAGLLMLASSLDTVPAHKPRCGPVGRDCSQEASGCRRECDALGWPGPTASVSSQNGFQPSSSWSRSRKGWPCRWKTVAWARDSQRQHDGAGGFYAEGRSGFDGELRAVSQSVWAAASATRTKGVLQVELLRQAIRGQRRAGGSGALRAGASLATDQSADRRASLPSWSRIGAVDPPSGRVDEASTRLPGASTSAPLRARNGSAGCPSMAIRELVILNFIAITVRWSR